MSLSKLKKAIAIFSNSRDRKIAVEKLKSATMSPQYNTKVVDNDYHLVITGTDAEIFHAKILLTGKGVEKWGHYKIPQPRVNLFPAIGATLPASRTPHLEPAIAILDMR